MPKTNISPTYRGYRRQALYVLWRVLTDVESSRRVFRPEGEEDLAVIDIDNRLIEVVQVKDYSSPLTLSDFKPSSADGFFVRSHRRLASHPECEVWIASFGQVGSELAGAIAGIGTQRHAVSLKLAEKNPAIPLSAWEDLFARLNGRVIHPNEGILRNDIQRVLAPTIAGVHGDTAIELLLFWIFDASEQGRSITRSAVLHKLERIGAYLSALRDYSSEWHVAVGPLVEHELLPHDRDILRASFRLGVQASWRHILAQVDSARPQRLAEIHEQFRVNQAVVIRGASGQGKSSLAFRYIRDFVAEGLRFYVRFVDGRAHAIRIANALRGHVSALGLRAVVLLDLSPSDSGWIELVRDLNAAGIAVLATVREEDFHRAGRAGDLRMGEVALDAITRDEAAEIYDSLMKFGSYGPHLDFDDVWSRFTTEDVGPLLEFTHLVTEGTSLTKKIEAQVARLQQEALTPAGPTTERHLQLLALASIANEAECRVSVTALCAAVDVDPLTRPLAALEAEYFLRTTTSGTQTVVAPLHGLRSRAVVAALLHDCSERWSDLAIRCLDLIVDADIERFLLAAFSRRPQFRNALRSALQYLPLRTWTHAAAVSRALLWEGVNGYERENHDALAASISEHGDGWILTCDLYLASDGETTEKIRTTIADALKKDESQLPKTHLTDKTHVFDGFREWASQCSPPSAPLTSASDWTGFGDIAFWVGSRRIDGPLAESVRAFVPEELPEDIPISDIAQFVSGRSTMDDATFHDWLASSRQALSSRFVQDTESLAVIHDGDSVEVLFPVKLVHDASVTTAGAHDFHAQALKRIALLRHLFPRVGTIKSRGVGADVLSSLIPHDETIKAIPAASLPMSRQVQVNAIFRRLVAYRFQRARNWSEYAQAVFAFRRSACDAFRGLQRGWARFLQHKKIQADDFAKMPGIELTRLQSSRLHMFPKNAVDEWGFVSEEDSNQSDPLQAALESQMVGNIQRFAEWRKVWKEYEPSVGRVGQTAVEASIVHLAKRNFAGDDPADSDAGRLTVVNLAFAWKSLRAMQREFRRWFAKYLPEDKLALLEQHEQATFRHFWPIAYGLIYAPDSGSHDASRLESDLREIRRQFLHRVRMEASTALGPAVTIRIIEEPYTIDDKACLVVVCDHQTFGAAEEVKPEIVKSLSRAARLRNWRPFESTPLEVEWSHVLIIQTVKGRAVTNAGSFVSTLVLFASQSDFEVQTHQLLPVPVDVEHLGIPAWDVPVIAKLLSFQGSSVVFMLAWLRFWSIAQAVVTHNLELAALEAPLRSYASELSSLREKATRDYEELVGVVQASRAVPGVITSDIDERLRRLHEHGTALLSLDVTDLASTMNDFVTWAQPVLAESNALGRSVTEIIDLTFAAAVMTQ